jgi:hypothetical protein
MALVFLLLAGTALSEPALPDSEDYESFEVEPPALVPPTAPAKSPGEGDKVTPADPAALEQRLERAKRSAAEGEQLFRRGVLSKMESEVRGLRVVRLQADLENARLKQAESELEDQRTRFSKGQISSDQLDALEKLVAAARKNSDAAAATRQRAEIAFAEENVRRQRTLAELGSARPGDVARAEQKLADLRAQKN